MTTPNGPVAVTREQAEADAQRRQDYYGARPGVPAGTMGANPEPLVLAEDRAVTGAHAVPGVQHDD